MFSILFQSQLHLQVQPHLSSARLPLLGSGTTKLLHLDHLSDLLSQPHLPRPQLLGPNPILPRPLDSRVTPPLYLGKVLIPHQVSGWLSSLMILVVTLKCNTFFFKIRWRLSVWRNQCIWSYNQQHLRCVYFRSRIFSLPCSPCQPLYRSPIRCTWRWIQLWANSDFQYWVCCFFSVYS